MYLTLVHRLNISFSNLLPYLQTLASLHFYLREVRKSEVFIKASKHKKSLIQSNEAFFYAFQNLKLATRFYPKISFVSFLETVI